MSRPSLFRLASVFKSHNKLSTWLPAIAVLAGVTLLSAPVLASSTGWYVAADAGQSRFSGIGTYGSPVFPDSFGSTGTGYRLSAGYGFSSYFGLELGYAHFGKVTGSRTELGAPPIGPTCGLPCDQSYVVNGSLKAYGWIFEAVGTYPFNDSWAIFARVGGIQAHSELDASYTTIPPYNFTLFQNSSSTSNDLDVTYGLGLQWFFADNWTARLSWDRYLGLGDELPMGSFNVSLTSIGIVYHF